MDTKMKSRPGIRIEIKNDIVEESMDIDENDEIEDGQLSEGDNEISDYVLNDVSPQDASGVKTNKTSINLNTQSAQSKWRNKNGDFTTGINIFTKEEYGKLGERAKRFGLDQSESSAMTDLELQKLHESLGITTAEEKNVRFEAIHMRGVEEMSTQDVFVYFNSYGPAAIEWINDYSCNVVWSDKISSARALHGLSKPICGMEFLEESNPFAESMEDATASTTLDLPKKTGRSILLIEADTSSKLDQNMETKNTDEVFNEQKTRKVVICNENEYVSASDIRIPIPPGYWRYGKSHPKAKSVLLRFALKTDRKPLHAEKLSEYYKKYGNPNFGGLRGIITTSRKRKLKGLPDEQIFPDESILSEVNSKNPWGSLAQNWNVEDRTMSRREMDYKPSKPVLGKPEKSGRTVLTPGKSIRERIGKVVRARNNEETTENDNSKSEEESEWSKKSKIPRMRMYADEEEEKIKAEKQKKISILNQEIYRSKLQTDLRNRLIKTAQRRNTDKHNSDAENQSTYSDHYRNAIDDHRSILLQQKSDSELSDEEDESRLRKQRSTISVVNKKPRTPKLASTVWSRVDKKRNLILRSMVQRRPASPSPMKTKIKREKTSDSESDSSYVTESEVESSDDDDSSDDDGGNYKRATQPVSLSERPQFNKGDLRSRLGFKPQDTLRIEVDNDQYNKK